MSIHENGRFVYPDIVTTHFHLNPGDRVADFGAGTGYFIKALSQAVGSDGRVYACEIQKSLLDKLSLNVQESRLGNVEPIWCDLEEPGGTKLMDGLLDAGILVNTLFQLENKSAALTEIARTLRVGGKLFLIDWTESFGGMGPQSTEVVDRDTAQQLTEAAGFSFDRSFDAGDHHYGLAFRRI